SFDENEFFFIGVGSDSMINNEITIPEDTEEGQYRMRVRVAAVGEDDATWDLACDETQGFGETEDYTVQIHEFGTTRYDFSDFSFYPNPVDQVLNIRSKQDIENISAYNLLGQEIPLSVNSAKESIDVSTLTEGVYLFKVTFEEGHVEIFKVIKK